jgi:hypothetical protein
VKPILVGLLLVTACKTVSLSAEHSVTPVMIGPVQRLGGSAETRSPDGTFQTALEDFVMSTSSSDGATYAQASRSASSQVDWDVLVATNGQDGRTIGVRSFRCVGYSFFAVFAAVGKSRCEASGDVLPAVRRPRPPRPAPATAPAAAGW